MAIRMKVFEREEAEKRLLKEGQNFEWRMEMKVIDGQYSSLPNMEIIIKR